MEIEGGCYCGALRYEATGDPLFRAQCHCRECQYISEVGTLDDPAVFEGAQVAIYLCDKQDFHDVPAGAVPFERTPG